MLRALQEDPDGALADGVAADVERRFFDTVRDDPDARVVVDVVALDSGAGTGQEADAVGDLDLGEGLEARAKPVARTALLARRMDVPRVAETPT